MSASCAGSRPVIHRSYASTARVPFFTSARRFTWASASISFSE
jgi:hypothetical protein